MKKKKQAVILKDILVQDYAAEGKSLAKVDGKVVFIEGVIPGDVVDVQLYKNKKDWAEGFPVHYKKFADNRLVPFCKHFGVCGGCQWQMLPYEKQLKYKQKQVFDTLTRIAKVDLPEINTIIGANKTEGYRNKVEFTFSNKRYIPADEFKQLLQSGIIPDRDGGFSGFHAKAIFDKVVEIDICHLQEEPTNEIRKAIVAFGLHNQLSFYDARLHSGWLRNIMIRKTTTNQLLLNIILGYEQVDMQKKLFNHLLSLFPQISTLVFTINTKFNDSIYDLTPQTFFGKGYIIEKLGDLFFKISPKSFFQTNTKQAEKLYTVTRNFAELTGKETVYDLYCGTGSIGIFVSNIAKKIIGVETVEDAIIDAKENAAINNIEHAHFFTGDVIDICTNIFFEENGSPDVIITDPPRAGMHEKLVKKLLDISAPVIVYVSCNPSTQARDLALLNEKYTVTKVQPVDMFPHTHHIENVVQLKLRDI